MGPVRVLILAVALTSAVGAALIVRTMAKGQDAPATVIVSEGAAPVQQPTTDVLVAKRDLPPGTTLTDRDLGWQAWPDEALNELFITKATAIPQGEENRVARVAAQAAEVARTTLTGPDAAIANMVGAVVREPILAGEPMTMRKVVRSGAAGIMAITLQSGMRAMAVPLSAESAAGGFILPGDHVDVVQSREIEVPSAPSGKRIVSETVMRNVKVLAIDQNTGAAEAAVVGATATLELTPVQAEVMVLAKAQGSLTLVLRSYADIAGPPQTVAMGDDALLKSSVVRVFRNAEPTEIQVTR